MCEGAAGLVHVAAGFDSGQRFQDAADLVLSDAARAVVEQLGRAFGAGLLHLALA